MSQVQDSGRYARNAGVATGRDQATSRFRGWFGGPRPACRESVPVRLDSAENSCMHRSVAR